jgi:hypothetical protein
MWCFYVIGKNSPLLGSCFAVEAMPCVALRCLGKVETLMTTWSTCLTSLHLGFNEKNGLEFGG